jgi:CubicO group peptidase (beta-lactamase class C family)
MKWILRIGLGLLGLVLALILLAAGWWVSATQFGWGDLPDGPAPTQSEVFDTRYEAAGQAALTALETMRSNYGVPGATAAVSIDGELVWAGAAGWSDLEAQSPMSIDSILRIGSTSKPMTATVLARLADAGTLAMTDTVADHATPLNPEWGPLQLYRLMSHTAGFPGYEDNTDFPDNIDTLRMRGSYASVEEGLRLVDQSSLPFAHGETYHYSSFDVNVAAWTAVMATGMSFPDLLGQQIREPLGLETPLPGDFGAPHPDQSVFYEIRNGDQVRVWPRTDVSQRWPGGGLVSRSRDLVLIGGAWLNEDFIAPETQRHFWTPVRLNDGTVNSENYAIGWRVGMSTTRFGEDHPVRVAHHGGVSRGAMSWLIIYPDLGLVAAVNINTNTPEFGDFASVEPEITRLFAEAAGRAPG